jgi:hypothetical protein
MKTKEQEIAEIEQQLPQRKDTYLQSMEYFLAVPKRNTKQRTAALRKCHTAGTDYFNAYERLISLGFLLGADKNQTWYTDKAETAANLLDTISRHYSTILSSAAEFDTPDLSLKPSHGAFANMQRLVKRNDPPFATTLRDQFVRMGLPVHGFDTEASDSPRATGLHWQRFTIGLILLGAALFFAAWGFSKGNLTNGQLFILQWILPLASGFGAYAFAGSITSHARGLIPGIVITATGGFVVWLLSYWLLKPIEGAGGGRTEYPVVNLSRPIEEQLRLYAEDAVTIVAAPGTLRRVRFGPNWEDYIPGRTYIVWGTPGVPIVPEFEGSGELKMQISFTKSRDQLRDLRSQPVGSRPAKEAKPPR